MNKSNWDEISRAFIGGDESKPPSTESPSIDLLVALRQLIKTSTEFAGSHTSEYLNKEKYRAAAWKAMLDSIIRARTAILKAEGRSNDR